MPGPTDTEFGTSGSDDPGYYEALGRAIRVLRTERGLARKELAEAAGLSYPYLSEIETGRKRPSSKALFVIAEALGVRPSEVLALGDRYGGRTAGATPPATLAQPMPAAAAPPPPPATPSAMAAVPASAAAERASGWRWFERRKEPDVPAQRVRADGPLAAPASSREGQPERQRLVDEIVRAAAELSDEDLVALLDLARRLGR